MKRAYLTAAKRISRIFRQISGRAAKVAPQVLTCAAFNNLIDSIPANADVFNRLEHLHASARYVDNRSYFVATTAKRKIVAAATLMPSAHHPGALAIAQISVDPEYKDERLGTQLVKAIFNHAAAQDIALHATSFEPEGWRCLAPVMARLHRQYPSLRIAYYMCEPEWLTGERPYSLTGDAPCSIKAVFTP